MCGGRDANLFSSIVHSERRRDDSQAHITIFRLSLHSHRTRASSSSSAVVSVLPPQEDEPCRLRRQIRETLTRRAETFNLILDDVSITHLVFGKEFTSAIEQKQVAQQEAERQTYIVAKAEQEKRAAIIRAEGEAQAATIISKALEESGSGLIEVRRIDAARDVAETLARSRGITYLPGGQSGGSNMLLGINTAQ